MGVSSFTSCGSASTPAHDNGYDQSSSKSSSINRRVDTTLSDAATLAKSSTRSSVSPNTKASPPKEHASRSAHNLASSPLDNINPQLYTRFPRFSTTTEISQPELSLEDVASTRFSADEEGIVSAVYNKDNERHNTKTLRLGSAARKLILHQSTLLKRAALGIKHVPSSFGLVSKFQEKVVQSSVQDVQNLPRSLEIECRPHPSQPALSRPYECTKNSRDIQYRTVNKLSALEEILPSLEDKAQRIRLDEAPKARRQPATHFPPNTAPFKFPPPANTVELFGYAYERPPIRRSSLAATGQHLPRSLSYGSVGAMDLRYFPFEHGPDRPAHFSKPSSRQSSLNSLSQTISSRPYSRPVSARNVDEHRMMPQLQREMVYVDIPQPQEVDFVLPGRTHPDPASSCQSLAWRPQSRKSPYHSIHQDESQHLRVTSGCSIDLLQIQKTHHKMPLFVPKEIKKDDSRGSRHVSHTSLTPVRDSSTTVGQHVSDRASESQSEALKRALSECSMICLPSEKDLEDGAVEVDLPETGTIILSSKMTKRGNFAEIVTNMKTRNFWYVKEEKRKISFGKSCGERFRKIQGAIRGRRGDAPSDSDEGDRI